VGAESIERAREPRLDSPASPTQHLGGLGLRQLEEVPARDHQAILFPQGLDGGEQRLLLFPAAQCRLGGGGRLPRGSLRSRAQYEAGAATRGPAPVAGFVGHDLENPGTKRCAGPKAAECVVGLHETFLGCVFRLGRVSDDEVRRTECDPLVCLHELSIGALIAPFGSFDEL
jgi:hypothetical protein